MISLLMKSANGRWSWLRSINRAACSAVQTLVAGLEAVAPSPSGESCSLRRPRTSTAGPSIVR
jgi:hypothetical protein